MKRLSKYFVCINQHSLVFGSEKKCKKGLKKKFCLCITILFPCITHLSQEIIDLFCPDRKPCFF